MSKRFIDTGIFDDDWFMDLSKDGKLLWIYIITKCDHAGMIKINSKLCKIQTGIKDLAEIVKELGNRLVTVSELLFFVPKYIEFQYPGFPNSKVRQQNSAFEILLKYGLIKEGELTVSKDLPKSYVNVNVNDNDNEGKRGVGKKDEKPKPEDKIKLAEYVEMTKLEHVKLLTDYGEELTKKFITTLDNYKGSSGKKYRSDYRAVLSWVIDKVKTNGKPVYNNQRNAKPTEPDDIDENYNPYAYLTEDPLYAK